MLRARGDYHAALPLEWLSRASDMRVHHARPIIVDGQVVGVLLLSRSPRGLFRGIYEDRGKIALGVGLIFTPCWCWPACSRAASPGRSRR